MRFCDKWPLVSVLFKEDFPSHHFDSPTAREDRRINVCDFYLFGGNPGIVAMAMTVNPDAGASAPASASRDEAIYAFRADLDGDHREDLTFKIRFGSVTQAGRCDEHRHLQKFEIRRATGISIRAESARTSNSMIAAVTGVFASTGTGVKSVAALEW